MVGTVTPSASSGSNVEAWCPLGTLGRAALALQYVNNNSCQIRVGSLEASRAAAASSVDTKVKPRSEASRWTRAEDARLHELVSERPEAADWGIVARALGGQRSAEECERRWRGVVSRGLQKGRFTAAEDELIVAAVADDIADINWVEVASKVKGRTPKQCRERWQNSLDPSLTKRKDWSADEDALLREAHNRWKNCWGMIVKALPGRSQNMAKNRWNSSLRRLAGDNFGKGAIVDAKALVAAIPDEPGRRRKRPTSEEDDEADAARCLSYLSRHGAPVLHPGDVLRVKWCRDRSLDEKAELVRVLSMDDDERCHLECLEVSRELFRMDYGTRPGFTFHAKLHATHQGLTWRLDAAPDRASLGVVEPPVASDLPRELEFLQATMTTLPLPALDDDDELDTVSDLSLSLPESTDAKRRRAAGDRARIDT